MKRLLVRILLPLCILLLSGYSHLSSQTHEESLSPISISNITASGFTSIDCILHDQAFIHKSSTSGRKTNPAIIAFETDIEEELRKSKTVKKYLDGGNFFIKIFHDYQPESFIHYFQNSLSFRQLNFSHFPSPGGLYLMLQVFRL